MRCIATLPITWSQRWGGRLGLLAYRLNGLSRRNVEDNLTLCFPELGSDERDRLVRAALVETGRGAGELPAIWYAGRERLRACLVDPVGGELLTDAVASGQGVLIAAPHLGCWEAVNHFITQQGYPLTALYRPPRQPSMAGMMLASRQRFGARLAPTSVAGVRQLLTALRRGECVGILPDQDPGPQGMIFADFFGLPTATMTLFGSLAARSAAVPLLVYVERLDNGLFRPVVRSLPGAVRDPDPEVSANALNRSIERAVRGLAEQYLWVYRRFKTAPAGSPPRYRNKRP